MRRGELYRVYRRATDTREFRVFVLVSRQALIDSRFSTVVCAPVYSRGTALLTQVPIGINEGLKHDSWITCDDLKGVRKSDLTQFIGSLSPSKIRELDRALAIAVGLP